MKKPLCFLVAASNNIAFAAGNIAIALDRYMSIGYELLIYSGDMNECDRAVCNSIPNTTVVDFHLDKDFVEYMLRELPQNCRFRDENRLMRFCHYEAFRLLDKYENVVWIDADMSVQGDLSEIIKYVPFGLTADTPWLVKDQFIESISGYDLERRAYCTGIMVLNHTIPYEDIYTWLYDNTKQYAHSMKNGDQAIINLMLQEFDITPVEMPLEEYQCICWKKEAIDAKVVHFGTERKVWNDEIILSCFPEWYRVHRLFLQKGGCDNLGISKNAVNVYHRYRAQMKQLKNIDEKLAAAVSERDINKERAEALERKLQDSKKEKDALCSEIDDIRLSLSKAEEQRERLYEEAEHEKELKEQLTERLAQKEREYEIVRNCFSYRLGRGITWFPRKIKEVVAGKT